MTASVLQTAYFNNLARVNSLVETVKRDRRIAKDDRRRNAEAEREKYQHDAEKFIGKQWGALSVAAKKLCIILTIHNM